MLGLQKRYKKVTAFVLTRSRQAERFHLAPFGNHAQIVTTKVTFSNNLAPACVSVNATVNYI